MSDLLEKLVEELGLRAEAASITASRNTKLSVKHQALGRASAFSAAANALRDLDGVVVPREPSDAMRAAGVDAYEEVTDGQRLPDGEGYDYIIVRAIYRAMLAASGECETCPDCRDGERVWDCHTCKGEGVMPKPSFSRMESGVQPCPDCQPEEDELGVDDWLAWFDSTRGATGREGQAAFIIRSLLARLKEKP